MQDLVRSRSHPLVKRVRALKAGREMGDDVILLEGWRLIEEALASGIVIVEVALAPRVERARTDEVTERLLASGANVRRVSDDVMDVLAETQASQGILAIARRPAFDEDRIFRGTPLIVVGVGIQNPGNVGALLRTAEAAGATGAYLTTESADPLSWKALRGSMGSAFRLPHVTGARVEEVLARLSARGVPAVATAASADDGAAYDAMDFTGPVAFLFGNEGAGLPPDVAGLASRRVAIPMAPPVESLNVAVAAGIVLYEAARQRRG